MEFQFSKRAESFQPNIFNILNEKRQALIESGKKIYNMSVGTPGLSAGTACIGRSQ